MKTNNKSNEDDDGKRNDKIIKDLPSAMYSVRRAVIEECVRSGKPSSMTTAAMTADDQYDDDDNDDDNNDDDNNDDG
jgi:hypothetical protein